MKGLTIKCHVCGTVFVSSQDILTLPEKDGVLIGTCNMGNPNQKHTPEEIRASYTAKFPQSKPYRISYVEVP
jgi:hypothetical protein